MIVMQWIGVGYMLLFLGAVPLTLVQFGAFVGTCARVVGISGLALAAVLTVTCFVSYWPTKNTIGKVVRSSSRSLPCSSPWECSSEHASLIEQSTLHTLGTRDGLTEVEIPYWMLGSDLHFAGFFLW